METYWNLRARKEYMYRGEKFYTITAIPYYYKRRRDVINVLKNIIESNDTRKICDIGCGDGEYIHLLCQGLEGKGCHFLGIDASEEMIKVANERLTGIDINKNRVSYYVSDSGIVGEEKFDLIYMVAVCAHISEETLNMLMNNIYRHLRLGGYWYCLNRQHHSLMPEKDMTEERVNNTQIF